MAKVFQVGLRLKAFDSVSATLGKVTGKFRKLGGTVRKVSNRFHLMQRRTEALRKSLRKVGAGMRRVGRTLATRVSLPILALGGAIIRVAATFEKSMNKVRARTTLVGNQFNELKSLARELGASTQFSAAEAAGAMAFLAQANFDALEIMQATPQILNLAAASETELGRAADIASNIMGGFGIKAKETGRVTDVLAAVTASANVDMEMLAETMKKSAPIARKFGASLEDTAAAAGLLGNLGIQGSDAGTAMKRAFLSLGAPTTAAAKLLQKAGIRVADSSGKMRRFSDIMTDLGKKLGKLPQQAQLKVLNALFGKIGIAAGAALQEFGVTGELEKFSDRMKDVSGTAKRMADIMNEGAAGSLKAFQSALEEVAISIGESGLLPWFTRVIKKLTSWTRSLGETSQKMLKWGVVIALVAAALGPLLIAVGAVVAMLPAIITGFSALGAVFTFVSGPIGLAIAALALLAYGIRVVIKHWDWFLSKLEIGADFIHNYFLAPVDLVLKKLKSFFKILPSFVKKKLGIMDVNVGGLGEERKRVAPRFGEEKELKGRTDILKKQTRVVVDFKNLPKETKIRAVEGDTDALDINTGLQAAAL